METKRLDAIKRLRLLGTPAEERFDVIARMAKRLLGADVAMIDLVYKSHVFLKSSIGLDAINCPKNISYCAYTIQDDNGCLIEDSLKDQRTANNPYATAIRSYAGMPLKSEGERVGSMCVYSSEPRKFSDDEIAILRDLALLAERELHVTRLTEIQLELAEMSEELEERAYIDELTRIWNRGAIMRILETELRRNERVAIMVLDADHFKTINDTYGHGGGDEVLRQLSSRLRASIRPLDSLGRYGGEEFLIIMPDCSNPLDAKNAAERLCAAIASKPVKYNGFDIPVTVSIGVAVDVTGIPAEHLFNMADEAMYIAKKNGRNQVHLGA